MSLLVWLPLIKDTKNQGLHNSTITTTGTLAYNAGKIGNALTFSNSALTLKPAPLDTNTKEFSFAFWFKTTNTSATQCLYNGRTAVGSALAVFLIGNKWRFDDGNQKTFNFGATASTWEHIVITRDETNTKLYINGELKQTMSSASFTCATASASIGMSSTSNATPSANAIVGQVNDYRIYNHVLSAKEIKELAKGLFIHLPLDGGANPNMIKNSYTWMNKSAGSHWVSTGSITKAVIEDNTAPCKWVYKVTKNNSEGTATATGGAFYGYSAQGLELTDLVEGETYTYSFWAKADISNDTSFNLQAGSICESQTLVSSTGFSALDSNWRWHTVTFTWTKTTKLTACFYCNTPAGKTQIFYCCGLKLEKGNKATPYIPHVSEAAYTDKGYANLIKQDCAGFNQTTSILSVPINGGISPKGNSCTYFDGTDDGIQIDNTVLPKIISEKFTMSFWIKPDGETGARSVYFGSNGNTAFVLSIEKNTSNQLRYYWNIGAPDYNNTAFTIADDTWQHVAIVRESATSTKFYKNGSLVNTYTTNCPAITSNTSNFYLGRDNRTGTTCYKGYMSDFRMYASALSADDIKELYQIPAQIDKSGKVYCNTFVEV